MPNFVEELLQSRGKRKPGGVRSSCVRASRSIPRINPLKCSHLAIVRLHTSLTRPEKRGVALGAKLAEVLRVVLASPDMDRLAAPIHMLAVPKLQRNQVPDNLAEKTWLLLVQTHQPVEKACAEIATLAGARVVQEILCALSHARVLPQPQRHGHAEAVLLLVEYLLGQNALHRLLEDVPLFKTSQLERRRYSPGKLSQAIIEERIANPHAREFRGAGDLSQIVVRKRHLQVEIEDSVQLAGSVRTLEMSLGNSKPVLGADLLEKATFKYFFRR